MTTYCFTTIVTSDSYLVKRNVCRNWGHVEKFLSAGFLFTVFTVTVVSEPNTVIPGEEVVEEKEKEEEGEDE